MIPRWSGAPLGRFARATIIEHTPDRGRSGLQAAVLTYRTELARFLKARRASPDEAEDILQDLYVRVRTLRAGPIAEPRAYLYRVAGNLLADRRRAAARRSLREQLWTESQLGAEQQERDESPSVERELAAKEELAIVSKVLAALPERTAEILRRFRIDDEEQKEIAADLGISLSAVEKHLQRAYRAVIDAQSQLNGLQSLPHSSETRG